MKEASVFKRPYKRTWPIKHLLLAWVFGLLTTQVLSTALDGPHANMIRHYAQFFVFFIVLIRILFAVMTKEKSIGWAFWFPVLLFFAPIWIIVLEPFLWQFR